MANDAQVLLAQNIIDGFTAAIHEAGRSGSRQLKTLGQALSAGAIPPSRRQAMFEEMGRNAQRSVQQAFTHRKNRRNIQDAKYRERPTRMANGALLRAIQNKDFYQATPDGLNFINTEVLNAEARHWRRLNFGAGARAGAPPRTFSFQLLAQASIGLEPDPRPAFRLPPGFWVQEGTDVPPGPRGTSAFFPSNAAGRLDHARMTAGIEATNFLDAGVRRIANDLGPSLLKLYRDFFHDAPGRVSFEQRLDVRAPQPRTFNFKRQR